MCTGEFCENLCRCNRILSPQQVAQIQSDLIFGDLLQRQKSLSPQRNLIPLRRQRFSQKFSSTHEAICRCDVSSHRVAATSRQTCSYIEDITRWREDMNFMFEWQEQYLTSERSERVRYCSCHENIKFISSSQRVMFFLLYDETKSTKAKGGNRDVIKRYDTHKGDIRKIRHSGPG